MAASLALLVLAGSGAFGQQVEVQTGQPMLPPRGLLKVSTQSLHPNKGQVMTFTKEADPSVPAEPLLQAPLPFHPSLQYQKQAGAPALPAQAAPHRQVPPVPGTEADIRQTVLQQPMPMEPTRVAGEGSEEYQIQLQPPGKQRLFRLESEDALKERMRQEARERPIPERIEFPAEPVISTDPYAPRMFPPTTEIAEPAYTCYGRLMFEQRNYERWGWDLGIINPGLSALTFFADVAILPYNLFREPWRCYDCSAGYCLPGDAVPFLIYPPQWSITGGLAQAGTTVLLFAIFP